MWFTGQTNYTCLVEIWSQKVRRRLKGRVGKELYHGKNTSRVHK